MPSSIFGKVHGYNRCVIKSLTGPAARITSQWAVEIHSLVKYSNTTQLPSKLSNLEVTGCKEESSGHGWCPQSSRN